MINNKRRTKFYSFLELTIICLSLSILLNCNNKNDSHDPEVINDIKNFRMPVYSNENKVNEYYSKKLLQKIIKYKIEMHYPAEKAISFYKKQLEDRQFSLLNNNQNCDWRTFIDGTRKGEPEITLCKLSWGSLDKTKRADLVLRYYWWKKEKRRVLNSNKDLEVEFIVQPFYQDIRGYKEIMEK